MDDVDEAQSCIADWRQRWLDETDACWAITAPGGPVAGRVALRSIDLAGGQGECTYWMLPEARGQ